MRYNSAPSAKFHSSKDQDSCNINIHAATIYYDQFENNKFSRDIQKEKKSSRPLVDILMGLIATPFTNLNSPHNELT